METEARSVTRLFAENESGGNVSKKRNRGTVDNIRQLNPHINKPRHRGKELSTKLRNVDHEPEVAIVSTNPKNDDEVYAKRGDVNRIRRMGRSSGHPENLGAVSTE